MGALAPVTPPWIPKDDLLLKNAIEGGASLESLAKGAVQFSRRFTIKELQDRWYALLYDPDISTEASVQMTEFERSVRKLPSKSSRAVNSKLNKCGHGKRKAESIRSYYNAMLKKIRSEPLNSVGLSLPVNSYDINGSEAPGVNDMLRDPMAIHFGPQDINFEDFDVFSQIMRNSAPWCGVGEFPNEQPDTLEDSIEQNSVRKEIPPGDNIGGNCTRLGQMDPSKELPGDHSIFQAIEVNLVSNSKGIMSSDFGGKILNSSVPDCETSFHLMQYTSAPPEMPEWNEIEGISVQGMPDDVNIKGSNVLTGDSFNIPDDGGVGRGTSEYNIIHLEHNHLSCGEMKNSADCTEGYFVDLTDTLFNFTNEDILEDAIDKSYLDGLSSLLLNSPYEANDDEMPKLPDIKEPAVPVTYSDVPLNIVPEERNSAEDSHLGDIHKCTSDTQTPTSASTVSPQFLEYRDGVICCNLNTEDPEIPCNDHIVFSSKHRPTSAHRRTQNEANYPSVSGKDGTGNLAREKIVGTMGRDPKQFGESNPASQLCGPEIRLNRTVDELGMKFKTSRVESLNCSQNPITDAKGASHSGLAGKKEPSELLLIRQSVSNVADKSCHSSDSGRLQSTLGGVNQEGHTMRTVRNQGFYAADLVATEHGGEFLLSDQSEEHFSDSDADIPCFSDIESMILDMDLGPDDQDSFCCSQVANYQHKDVMRGIIRLEQNARSCMRRTIASHGAFAVLHGRLSKHYIKKPEVLLGRATENVAVDIDLGMEGRANKISRRQAIIKMDKDGSFDIKNLGQRSIHVHYKEDIHKEVFPGESASLHSDCLIEIREMPFIFEINQRCVKRYLSNVA